MTFLETATLDGLAGVRTRWSLSELRLCNWGGFQGYVTATVAPDATLVCGETGSGKSTLLDAYMLLLNQNSVSLNAASNAAGGRHTRRNPLTYTLGQYAAVEDRDGTRVRTLRGCDSTGRRVDTWSGIAAVFRCTTGEAVTVARLFYATASATHPSDLTTRFALYDGALDLRAVERFANDRFPDGAMARALPGYHPFNGYAAFAEQLFRRLNIGDGATGRNAVRLMQKVQSSAPIESVDRLYKDLVLDEPATFNRADDAVAAFENLRSTYQGILTAERQMHALAEITDDKRRYDDAARTLAITTDLGDLAGDTPFALWATRHRVQLLQEAEDDAAAKLRAATAALTEQERRAETADRVHQETRDEWLRQGGGEIVTLQHQVDELEQHLGRARRTTAGLATILGRAGLPVPDTQDGYLDLIRGKEQFDRADERTQQRLRTEHRDAVWHARDLSKKTRELQEQIATWQRTPTRVRRDRVEVRDAYADAMGLQATDLPFLAELIDIRHGQEDWRAAANAVMGGWAQNLVTDAGHRQRLRQTVERYHHRFRLSRTAVTSGLPYQDNADTSTLAGKVIVKDDSPFAGWVRDYLDRHFSYECVPGPDQLGTDGVRRVTPAGQTSTKHVDTHGGTTLDVLGFTNTDLIDDARVKLDQLENERTAAEADEQHVEDAIALHQARRDAYTRIAEVQWADIDLASLAHRLTITRQELSELQDADNPVAVLGRKVAKLARDATTERERVGPARTARDDWEARAAQFMEDKDQAADRCDRLAQAVQVTSEQQDRLDQHLADLPWPHPDTALADLPGRWDTALRQVSKRVRDDDQRARDAKLLAERNLTHAFRGFNDQWPDPDHDRGDSPAEYPEFARILAELHHHDLPAQKQQWARKVADWGGDHIGSLSGAYRITIDAIRDRLDAINSVLSGIPFRDDQHRLAMQITDRAGTSVTQFKHDLEALATEQFTVVDATGIEAKFSRISALIDRVRPGSPERDLLLDVRRHLRFTAAQHPADSQIVVDTFDVISGGGKSGGESQELIAFIVGAALRFQLGDMDRPPRFAPVVLDEAFIKADGRFAARGLAAWQTLGFQLIIGAPESMVTALEAHVGHTLTVAKDHAEQSFVHLAREVKDPQR